MQAATSKSRAEVKTTRGRKMAGKPIADPVEVNVRFAHNVIATAAYYKAVARGFASGQELDDWLQAEAEFNQRRI
ncbi:MAG: DUF2934 domain-containing protein [Rhodocyclaceae bacterium]|jgi:hypothetical protein|nr:DUF2934 domain-containing protein [Rhodocyclaceae bacterium]